MEKYQKYKNILALATQNNSLECFTYLSNQFENTYAHEGVNYWVNLLEISKMHSNLTNIYASASEHFKPQIENYCEERIQAFTKEKIMPKIDNSTHFHGNIKGSNVVAGIGNYQSSLSKNHPETTHPIAKPKKEIRRIFMAVITGIVVAVISGYILHKMGWV